MEKNKQISKIPVCCESCRARNNDSDEFRRLISVTSSGLSVYITNRDSNKKDSVILHNIGNKVLKKPDLFNELSRRKTKCFLCNILIQRVCNLINEVTEIKEKETIAICEHCKRATVPNTCKTCDEILKQFLHNQINQYQYRQQALKIRLYEVRRILSIIVDKKNICDHKICQAYYDQNAELKILLELTKSPLPKRRPDIDEYFSLMEPRKESIHGNVDSDLFLKYSGGLYDSKENLVASSSSESRSESFCICKYLRDRKIEASQSLSITPPNSQVIVPSLERQETQETSGANDELTGKKIVGIKESKTKITKGKALKDHNEQTTTTTSSFDEKIKNKGEKKTSPKKSSAKKKADTEENKENIPLRKEKGKKGGKEKENEEGKAKGMKKNPKQDSEYMMMMKLMKEKNKEKDKKRHKEESAKKTKLPAFPKIEALPEIKKVEKYVETESETSGSIAECSQNELKTPREAILGNQTVPFSDLKYEESQEFLPVMFKVKHEFVPADKTLTETLTSTAKSTSEKTTTSITSKKKSLSMQEAPGIIKYELSNQKFIEEGWTQLPCTKIVRRMYIYKMVPACPQFDWFANHKDRTLFYNTGEKLAEVDSYGFGMWFYKDGRVALNYYKSKDAGLIYDVYDSDDVVEWRKIKPRKIKASFDNLGNGIVYDHFGNARLKYNQSEGMVIDKKLGPPGKWKWHTLNDPPVLQHMYVDNVVKNDKCFKGVVKQHINDPDLNKRVVQEQMLAIEFDNFVKERAKKMLQRFKPFEIRIKAVKINEYFSLRIINQANILLLFRSSQMSLKVNLGMLLISSEIIDTKVSDVADVATPFDRPMSSSSSSSSSSRTSSTS